MPSKMSGWTPKFPSFITLLNWNPQVSSFSCSCRPTCSTTICTFSDLVKQVEKVKIMADVQELLCRSQSIIEIIPLSCFTSQLQWPTKGLLSPQPTTRSLYTYYQLQKLKPTFFPFLLSILRNSLLLYSFSISSTTNHFQKVTSHASHTGWRRKFASSFFYRARSLFSFTTITTYPPGLVAFGGSEKRSTWWHFARTDVNWMVTLSVTKWITA